MNTERLTQSAIPAQLRAIPQPPSVLYTRGAPLTDLEPNRCLAVIGSRAATPYARQVIELLLPEIVRAGIVIVSGLALGTDSLAHRCALAHGGQTIAILPAGVESVYPASHRGLAEEIVTKGGTLVSEYPPGTAARREHFIARNRLISGLSTAVLIIEAAQKSGTLHTATFALEQGRDVLAVPGAITSPHSVGTNQLIKSGAQPITSSTDLMLALNITEAPNTQLEIFADNEEERSILKLLTQGVHEGSELLLRSHLPAARYHEIMTLLELKGCIKPLGNDRWGLSRSALTEVRLRCIITPAP